MLGDDTNAELYAETPVDGVLFYSDERPAPLPSHRYSTEYLGSSFFPESLRRVGLPTFKFNVAFVELDDPSWEQDILLKMMRKSLLSRG
jgi:hypothetical protein